MSIELKDVLAVSREIQGNYDSGTHYFLGYLWASTSDEEKIRIAKSFADELKKIGEK